MGTGTMIREQIQEHMEVLGSDGRRVGTVDRVESDRIKLAKDDSPDRKHHYVLLSAVASVDQKVHLKQPRASAAASWSHD